MKILIIYENIPESTFIYSVEVTEEEWSWIQLCNGGYINGDSSPEQEDACNRLARWLGDKQELTPEDGKPVMISDHKYVVVTGFLM
jgi:hypothetical protein